MSAQFAVDDATALVEHPLAADVLAARWQALIVDESSPEFFELNQYGELILSPAPANRHEVVASEVMMALQTQLGRQASAAVSIHTDRGIRRPDAVWMPLARWVEAQFADPLPFAPDICVEVLSPSNSNAEITMKIGAYLRAGAKEVIVIGTDGTIQFWSGEGRRQTSAFNLVLALPAELF